MRITFVVNNYPPRVGGVENHVGSLSRHLAAAGHEVVVHTLTDGSVGESLEDGVRVHRWRELFRVGGLLGFPTPVSGWQLARAAARDTDIISVNTRFFPLTWLGVLAGRMGGVPVLHTEHGSDFVASDSALIRWGSRLVDLSLGRWALRAATAVVGVSDEVVAFVRRLSGVRAAVFHNAIEAPDVRLPSEPRRHLVFVSRIVGGKGWEDFLDTVAASDPDVTAEVLGDGPQLAQLRARVAELGLGDRVAVRGRVPLSQVFEAVARAVLVNPTRLSEGFQTTLLEALAVGARVVTYPVPGAALLAELHAPVRVVERSAVALADTVREELASPGDPWPPEQLAAWTWEQQSRRYADLAQEIVRKAELQSKP